MRRGIIVSALVGLLLVPLVMAGVANAASFRSGNNVTISKSEVVDSTVFVAGQTIEIAGEINGDVFCAGNSVTVSGVVHGDVICAGQSVQVSGTVDGDVRLAGSTVNVQGKVTGNAMLAGQTVTVHADGAVRDLHAVGTNLVVNGAVSRDADVGGEVVDLNGTIGRNVQAGTEHLSLGEKSKINGSLLYQSNNEVNKASGATVVGPVKRETPPNEHQDKRDWMGMAASWAPFIVLSSLVTAMVLAALMPRFFFSLSNRGITQPGWSILSGVGLVFLTPLLVALALITLVGAPLAGILLLGMILALLLSGPVFSFFLGRLLLRSSTNNALYYMLLGSAIMLVLYFIPVLGVVSMIVATIFGGGMLVLELIQRTPSPRYQLVPAARTAKTRK